MKAILLAALVTIAPAATVLGQDAPPPDYHTLIEEERTRAAKAAAELAKQQAELEQLSQQLRDATEQARKDTDAQNAKLQAELAKHRNQVPAATAPAASQPATAPAGAAKETAPKTLNLSTETTETELQANVDKSIILVGAWKNEGKLGPYIASENEKGQIVYIRAITEEGHSKMKALHKIPTGTHVQVTGILRSYEPPPPAPNTSPITAQMDKHFYFDAATAHVEPRKD